MNYELLKYLPALIVSLVWGTTFVISKSILEMGVTPFQLITCRFVMAYIALCIMCPKPYKWELSKTELKMFFIGLTGGSLYFFLEYSGLKLTSTANVGLICATVPIVSACVAIILGLMKPDKWFAIGSLIALSGVACVVLNGMFVLKLNPWGDFVTFMAVVSWAIYSALLTLMPKDVTELQATRRLFFYGAITISPALLLDDSAMPVAELLDKLEWNHIVGAIYLGLIASGASLWLWNISFFKIGAASTNSFLYLLPIISAIASAIFYSSEITMWTVIGTLLIFTGLIIAKYKELRQRNKDALIEIKGSDNQ